MQSRLVALKTLTELKLERCRATFTEEQVLLVAQCVEGLNPEIQDMINKLTAIHSIYQLVRHLIKTL
jgi:hypothetical protein